MTEIRFQPREISSQLATAARRAVEGGAPGISDAERESMLRAAQADGNVTNQEREFIASLEDTSNQTALREANFDPQRAVFNTSAATLQGRQELTRVEGGLAISRVYSRRHLADESTAVNLSSPAGRRAALNNLSQRDQLDDTMWDSQRCGVSCLVAAAVDHGAAGVTQLIDAISPTVSSDPEYGPMLAQIRQRAQSNQLTIADLHRLQEYTHHTLRSETHDSNPGAHISQIQNFVQGHHLNNLLSGNSSIWLLNLDNNPDTTEHFVLRMSDGNIYDPEARRGGQVIQQGTPTFDNYSHAYIQSM